MWMQKEQVVLILDPMEKDIRCGRDKTNFKL